MPLSIPETRPWRKISFLSDVAGLPREPALIDPFFEMKEWDSAHVLQEEGGCRSGAARHPPSQCMDDTQQSRVEGRGTGTAGTAEMRVMRRPVKVPASYFSMVLGLSGLGQAWHTATQLWGLPPFAGETLLAVAGLVWAVLIIGYISQAIRNFDTVRAEFLHPVQGGTPALLGISTLLIAIAMEPHSTALAWGLTAMGIAWHISFSLWHTGTLWQGGKNSQDMIPTLYLPTVAGNLVSAAALGSLGFTDWGWPFLGAGLFSWLALESLIVQRLWHSTAMPAPQRPLIGIQFAPPVVCAMAWLQLSPGSTDHWLLMLWGYGLFELLLGLRLWRWLGVQPFTPAYWAYTFGVAAATVTSLKLAQAGVHSAQLLALPLFVSANLFIGYLALRTVGLMITHALASRQISPPQQNEIDPNPKPSQVSP